MANEKRLIDANALRRRIANTPISPATKFVSLTLVDDAPTVDAVPVVHGRWELQRYYGGVRKGLVARVICSECGYPSEKTNYCAQCGAKMDGDGNGTAQI